MEGLKHASGRWSVRLVAVEIADETTDMLASCAILSASVAFI